MSKSSPFNHSQLRVAASSMELSLGDVAANVESIVARAKVAAAMGAEVIAFPELSLTGYSLGDLFENTAFLKKVQAGIEDLAQKTASLTSAIIVGAPLSHKNALYNCAVVLSQGQIVGVVPKSYLPNYKEFYEKRWFRSGRGISDATITIGKHLVDFGTDLLFQLEIGCVGIEICEDLWAPSPPSVELALAGADVIVNLSASNELVGKATYRTRLVAAHSANLITGYVYVSSDMRESTADVVFGGHRLIVANGSVLAEHKAFADSPAPLVADVDIEHLRHDRRVNTTFEPTDVAKTFRTIRLRQPVSDKPTTLATIDPHPFVPSDPSSLNERAEDILAIQSHGLATYMRSAGIQKAILGLSGGLDSTLATLVALRAMDILGLSSKNVITVTMPGFASSDRTQSNAAKLAGKLGTTFREIPIIGQSTAMLASIGHDTKTQDVTYENSQARIRTEILMNLANSESAVVVGTGDLSEIALGWATFNGDHMSMYNVNSSIPKTLVRHLVAWLAHQPEFAKAQPILEDILATPVSPELKNGENGIGQRTEDIIGPYELHDFFLYYLVRHADSREKIAALAEQAFKNTYSPVVIGRWLDLFLNRFTRNQFKRESAPNGPKVGSVSLSQRGDWRMPPGASTNWVL